MTDKTKEKFNYAMMGVTITAIIATTGLIYNYIPIDINDKQNKTNIWSR